MATEGARRRSAPRPSRGAARSSAALLRLGLTPNHVSGLSVVFALGAGLAIAATGDVAGSWRVALLLLAAAGIQLRLLCNLFDGMMAVEGGVRTQVGDIYNDLPDRIADPLILISAGCTCRDL